MSIVSVSSLSASDLRLLGSNVSRAVRQDRLRAINRSLVMHEESVQRLYHRAGGKAPFNIPC